MNEEVERLLGCSINRRWWQDSPTKSARVCRGVLRVWGTRIQDSRTDFGGFWWKIVDSATTRGWCKIEIKDGDYVQDGYYVETYVETKDIVG
jgi:hypothetical protein